MASLSITKGTTKTFLFKIESDTSDDRTWEDMGTMLLRIIQEDSGVLLEKEGEVLPTDPTVLKFPFTQNETIKLEPGKFKMQLFSIVGPEETEIASKADILAGIVKPSLWEKAVHND